MAVQLRITNYAGIPNINFWVVQVADYGYTSPNMALTDTWSYSDWIAGGLPVWVGIYQTGVAIPKYAASNLILPTNWRKYRLEVNTSTLVDEGAVPGAPTPAGLIESTVEYWNPATGAWQSTVPTVPFGSAVGARATFKNTGTVSQSMYLKFTLKRPNGTTKTEYTASPVVLAPNATYWYGITGLSDAAGTWSMVIELNGDLA